MNGRIEHTQLLNPSMQAAQLFADYFQQCPDEEKDHCELRTPENADASDSEDSGLESILFHGD